MITVLEPNVLELVDRGMEEQIRRFRESVRAGSMRVGWKIGMTTPAAQRPFGLSAPVIGRLDGNRTFSSANSIPLACGGKIRAEGEMALRMDRKVTGEATLEEARAAISAVGPAIEFINLNMPKDDIAVVLGHSIFHEAVVFGSELPSDVLARERSFWPVGRRNSKCVRTPEPTMVPGDLAALVLLVARTLGRYGESLKSGDRIISGSYITPLIVEPGDVIEVDFGFLGKVTANTIAAQFTAPE